MIEEIILGEEKSIEDAKRKMYGVQVGRVINLLDPLTLGRVQVQLPSIDALDLAPWARVAMPMASILCGFYFIPQIGDQVLVAFEMCRTSSAACGAHSLRRRSLRRSRRFAGFAH